MNPHLTEVTSKIKQAILFFASRRAVFRADELRRYVATRCDAVAPASADRVLRDLRQRKQLNYVVVNRKKSLYRILPIKEQ